MDGQSVGEECPAAVRARVQSLLIVAVLRVLVVRLHLVGLDLASDDVVEVLGRLGQRFSLVLGLLRLLVLPLLFARLQVDFQASRAELATTISGYSLQLTKCNRPKSWVS